jgi:5-methylcytosine-specific restriction endonuclease McrA
MEHTHATCQNCGRGFEYIRTRRPQTLCSDACRSAKRTAAKAKYRQGNREKHVTTNKAWNAANREKVNAATKRWRSANPEKVRAQQRRRVIPAEVKAEIQRRRRARKKALTVVHFTVAQLAARLSMFAGCWMCGGPGNELDHVKPLSKGGAHMLGNIRRACRSCNAQKINKWPYPMIRAT